MNSSLVLLFLSSLIGTILCISIPLSNYQTFIGDRCFNETYDRKPLRLGQNNPVGMSIENLISLIEKVERKRPELSAQQIIVLILRRFHIDGLQQNYGLNEPSPIERMHTRVTDQIIGTSLPSVPEFPEDALTEDEKCSLFFTISHTVNETATHDEERSNTWQRPITVGRAPTRAVNQTSLNTSQPVQSHFLPNHSNLTKPWPQQPPPLPPPEQPLPVKSADGDETKSEEDDEDRRKRQTDLSQTDRNRAPFSQLSSTQTLTKNPREKGVASFRNNIEEAIAANRVLLGTAVGLLNPVGRSIRDITKAIYPDANVDRIVDGQLNPLLAVTISDLLAIDGGYGLTNPVGQLKFGGRGKWNSTACQTSYRLEVNGTLATLAELRGGIDGFNIGRKVYDIVTRNSKLSLSQILRMYYSNRGLTPDSAYCRRSLEINSALNDNITKEAENYLRIWNWAHHGGLHADTKLTGYIAETKGQFFQHLNNAAQTPTNDDLAFCNSPTSIDIRQSPCESQADVFFMLDNMNAPQNDANLEQIEVITQVVRTLDLRRSGGSVTVLVNSEGQSNLVDDDNTPITTPLYALAYNTTSSQCASCRSAWFDNRQMAITDRPRLMELINQTLRDYESKRASQSGVPSKNFVWFEFGNLKAPPTDQSGKRKYEDFKWRLRYEHRDVPFFLASLNKEPIMDLLRRDEDWINLGKGVDDARQRARELAESICKTPSTFQHTECRVRKSDNAVYEGFVTPGYKQYWSMFPEFFIKSYNIEFAFRAENAKIKVCFDRYPEPELQERHCKETNEDNGEVKFTVNNPCHRKTFENCDPFYFTLALSTQQSTASQECGDLRCRTLDQVKWTFTHKGISCNSSLFLNANYFHIVCAALILTIFFNKNLIL